MFLFLRSGKGDLPLGTEDVRIKVRDPLPAAGRDVEVADCGPNVRIYAFPVELRIEIHQVRRLCVTELPVESHFLEFMEQRTRLSNVMRVSELPDEIGRAQERAFFVIRILIGWRI